MSLPSRIIFVTSALLCAALCTWAALTFGEPASTPMWCFTAGCVVVAVVVWFIKARVRQELENIRVEGAREPTYRLVRSEKGAKGEIWQLVLGNAQCTLIHPDGTHASSFARKWADTAIRLPGFVSGELLGIVTEAWSPPDDDRWLAPDALRQAAKNIRHASDRDTPFYWFSPSTELTRVIDDYRQRTVAELGPEATGPLLINARRCIVSGAIGLAVGIGMLVFGIVNLGGQGLGQAKGPTRVLGFGIVVSVIGLCRLGQGFALYRKAGYGS